jgi:hypothetical protein
MAVAPIIPSMAAGIIIARIRKIVQRFREAGAVSFQTARRPEELNIQKRLLFQRLVQKSVLVEAGDGRYYLHEEKYLTYRKNRRSRALFMLVIVLLILYFFVISNKQH